MKSILFRFSSVGAILLLVGQAAAGERPAVLVGQATASERPVLGQGNVSCNSWLEGRQSDTAGSSRVAWVLGFMTAFNQYGSKSQADDVSEGKSTEELMSWLDDFCKQHPGDNLHRATVAFIGEFQRRTGR